MLDISQNIWETYGFLGNPFNTLALSVNKTSMLPIKEAFVGGDKAKKEMRILNNVLRSPGGGRIFVEGEIGVGKTTFINYHRYLWEHEAKDKLFSSSTEISIQCNWTVKDFLMNILSHLINKLLLVFGEKKVYKNTLFEELILLNRVYVSRSLQIGTSILGSGGNYGKSGQTSIPQISEAQLSFYFRQAVDEILKLGYKGIILHFDNLELMTNQEAKQTQHVFDEIRDILQIENVYYIFVSRPGFFREVVSPLERVRSIFFGWPIVVSPLTKTETVEVLERRYKLLSVNGKKFIRPVEDDFIEFLYDLYEGKIRFVMDTISSIIAYLPTGVMETLPLKSAKEILNSLVVEKLKLTLTKRELEVLMVACQFSLFTNSDLSKQTKIASRNISKYLNTLQNLNYISQIKKEGKNIYYSVTEDIKILSKKTRQPHTNRQTTKRKASPKTKELSFTEREKKLKNFAKKEHKVTVKMWAQLNGISLPSARKDLAKLEKSGYLTKHGQGRSTHYTFDN